MVIDCLWLSHAQLTFHIYGYVKWIGGNDDEWLIKYTYQFQVGCDYTIQNFNSIVFLWYAIHIICLISQ